MHEDHCKDFKEFVLVVEGKNHPIQAWTTHPEAVFGSLYKENDHLESQHRGIYTHHDGKQYGIIKKPDIAIEKRIAIAHGLSDGFTTLCRDYASRKPHREPDADLHLVFKSDDIFMLDLTSWGRFGSPGCYL